VAVTIGAASNSDIWILDLNRETRSRLTFNEGLTVSHLWTPDGQRIIYLSLTEEDPGYYSKKADGTGEVEKIFSIGTPRTSVQSREIRSPFTGGKETNYLTRKAFLSKFLCQALTSNKPCL
jgi:Tol biopolymer transport system component